MKKTELESNSVSSDEELKRDIISTRFKTYEQLLNILVNFNDHNYHSNTEIQFTPFNTKCPKCSTPRLYDEQQGLQFRWQCSCGRFLPNDIKASPFVLKDEAPICQYDALASERHKGNKCPKSTKMTRLMISTMAAPCQKCQTEQLEQDAFVEASSSIDEIIQYYRENPYRRGAIKRQMRSLSGLQKTKIIFGEIPKFVPKSLMEQITDLTEVDRYSKKTYFEVLFNLALGWQIYGSEFQGIQGMSRLTKESTVGKTLAKGNEITASSLCDRLQKPEVIDAASKLFAISGIAASSDLAQPVYFTDSMWLVFKGDSYEFMETIGGDDTSHAIKISLLRDSNGAIVNLCCHIQDHPSDQSCLQQHLMSWDEPNGSIFIFDRGYEDLKFFNKLKQNQYYFVMYFEEKDFNSTILDQRTFAIGSEEAIATLPKASGDEQYQLLSEEMRLVGSRTKVEARIVSFKRRDTTGNWTVRKIMTSKLLTPAADMVTLSFLRLRMMETGYYIVKHSLGLTKLNVKNDNSAVALLLLFFSAVNLLMLVFRHLHAEHGGVFEARLAKGTLRSLLELLINNHEDSPGITVIRCNSPICPYG